jgi:cytoskeletal protein RodZ
MRETLAEVLSDARRRSGKTIAEAEEETRIRAKHLQALEDGDYEALPNPAYVRGYIISYAKFLGLDPKPLLGMYRAEMGDTAERSTMAPKETVVGTHDQTHAIPWRITIAIIIVVIVAAIAYWLIGRLIGGDEPEELPPTPPVAEETETPPASATETLPGVTDTSGVDPAAEDTDGDELGQPFLVAIEVESGGASWLEVEVDGLSAYVGKAVGGESQEYDVTEEITILIGKPESVTVLRDGEPVEIPGGGVPELVLRADDPVE